MPIAQSSHVQEYDFSPESKSLVIRFTDGSVYRWSGVAQTDYDAFYHSGSKGSYLWSKLIPKHGKGEKLASAEPKRRGRNR